MGELEPLIPRFDPSISIEGEIASSVPADPDTPLTPYQTLSPRGPELCSNCTIRGGATGEVQVKAETVGMDTLCGYVILRAVDSSGNKSKPVRVNYDDTYGVGSDEALDAEQDFGGRVLLCREPKGRIPGFKKCGALAPYMQS